MFRTLVSVSTDAARGGTQRHFTSAAPTLVVRSARSVPVSGATTSVFSHTTALNSRTSARCSTSIASPSSLVSCSSLLTAQRYCSTADLCCLAAHGTSIASLRAAYDTPAPATDATPNVDSAGPTPPHEVTVRARVERIRGRGKLSFLHLRQPPLESLQAVCVGKELTAQAKAITPESIVDVTGVVQRAASPVQSTSCQHCELHVTSLRVVSAAATPLPFPYRDANTKLDTRLNHRVMDLRTERMAAVTRLVSALCQSFRGELLKRGFIEVHTPKLIAAASEGGSNVFTVDYFGKPAYLAQSPQLYKQMLLMGDAMRVFEIGPVFRAENSLTHRHLTEFVGLDGEMVIRQSHTEVLDVLEPVMCAILKDLTEQHGELIDVLWRQQQPQEGQEGAKKTSDASPGPAAEAVTSASSTTSWRERRGHALRDVCCEVPQNVMDSLHLTRDSATVSPSTDHNVPTSASHAGQTASTATDVSSEVFSSTDPYHARVGGGSSGCRVLRLAFADAARLLADEGGADVMAGCALPLTDFSLPQERRLGELIKQRYGVDLYVVDLFPSEARPFYTMPLDVTNPEGPTRSYDMYLRGEEICSGAQRVDSVALLEQRLAAKKVDASTVKDYVDAFRYGAWPHGGFGLGLERIALFFLDLEDIRHVSLFPRDPKRITP